MSLLPREAQNLLHSSFSCTLIPFSMFSLDYDKGKVDYPMERALEKTVVETFFVRNWRPNQSCTFLVGLPHPLHEQFYESAPKGGTKRIQ